MLRELLLKLPPPMVAGLVWGKQRLMRLPVLNARKMGAPVYASDMQAAKTENLRVVYPPERVVYSAPEDFQFAAMSGRYRTEASDPSNICTDENAGAAYFDRSPIFACDVPSGCIHVETGVVCSKDFTILADPGMEYRVLRTGLQNRMRPLSVKKIPGTVINLFGLYGDNYWHFLFDCLAKLYTLTQVEPHTPVTIPVPDTLSQAARETLAATMPETCTVRYVPNGTWIQADRVLFLSFASRLGNGHLPPVFISHLRDTIFARLGMQPEPRPSERIYISRAGARHRRVLNEPEVMDCLSRYGFKLVRLEGLSFREQVDLFRRAQIVAGPAGAGLSATLFSGQINVAVLYPNERPNTFFFTQIKGLGQRHHYLTSPGVWEEADFNVDILRLDKMIKPLCQS
jgi:hypothetical protein